MEARAHILVTGHVQGVFFRKSVMDLARTLHLTGWVRNLRDGNVEVVVEGEKTQLEELIEFCHEGPLGAKVREVAVEWSNFRGEFRGFQITH